VGECFGLTFPLLFQAAAAFVHSTTILSTQHQFPLGNSSNRFPGCSKKIRRKHWILMQNLVKPAALMRRVFLHIILLAFIVFTVGCHAIHGKKLQYQIPSLYSVDDPQFLQSMGVLLGPGIVGGNKATALLNGDQIFPSMLEAIKSAERTICFETYIYWSGDIGKQFANALAERSLAGVKVYLILDWIGSSMDSKLLALMEESGVQVEEYHPFHWWNWRRLNHRTHRKILVVDGKVGFTGGVGIADHWTGAAQTEENWRDSHFKLEGPAVGQMQAAFMDNWMKTRAEVLHGDEFFPALKEVGNHYAQVFQSSPREGSESVELMYLISIAAARKNIRISASYFIPDKLSIESIVAARKRGVEVELILPGPKTDVQLVRRASRSSWGELLKAGVKIYEYQPTMYHCKVMVVDDVWVSVGSANFDNRSFRLNDEANLNVYARDFAEEQIRIFEEDKKHSRQISYEKWKERSMETRIKEWFANRIRSQL
jgi:cardiolipin synthase